MIKKILRNIFILSIPAAWIYVVYRMQGERFTGTGIFCALLFASVSIVIIYLLMAIAYRAKNNEPVWEWKEPGPKKLPLWYRILSKFFD